MNRNYRRITIASVLTLIIVAVLFGCAARANATETTVGTETCDTSIPDCPPAPPECNTSIPECVPPSCEPYLQERENYFLQVISNYQNDLDFAIEQRDGWHESHDRVAGYAVERNWEYAALQEDYRKLYDKFVWKSDRVNQLKMKIAMLKARG